MGLCDLVQAEAREGRVAELEHAGPQREEASIAAHVTKLGQGAEETPRRCAGEAGSARDLAQGQLGMFGVKGANDREATLQGLHEVRADTAINSRNRGSIDVGHIDSAGGTIPARTSRAIVKARFARGTPAYTATWRRTSLISSTLTPLRRAARRCSASSSSMPCAASMATVMQLRVRRSSPGRDQTEPHAERVMYSWKSAVNASAPATARSTCSSPRTSRRVVIPCSRMSSLTPLLHRLH